LLNYLLTGFIICYCRSEKIEAKERELKRRQELKERLEEERKKKIEKDKKKKINF
jgi:hypothetical protein